MFCFVLFYCFKAGIFEHTDGLEGKRTVELERPRPDGKPK